MLRLAQTLPYVRLVDLLTGVGAGDGARAAVRAVVGEDLQRLFLGPQWSPRTRLEHLSELSRTAAIAPLPARERDTVTSELARLALRILWSEGLLGDVMALEAAPSQVASRLLELAASDLLPDGPAYFIIMKRARTLLQRHDVQAEVAADDALRHRLQDQLARAELRLDVVSL
ncbi:MAG: hypothetical protein IV086_15550 [Hyphomonadaceae bacterium]|nr:MAG: hypothetical protein FD160_3375 [Caulobacteraceae bacterium]MBT9447116.1 hypothetical protein [Hyphomonadaceae bacterium]TPW05803.1 MAG: hypothetical protein FD124_2008 [Alphaproteobacteria bacterium]